MRDTVSVSVFPFSTVSTDGTQAGVVWFLHFGTAGVIHIRAPFVMKWLRGYFRYYLHGTIARKTTISYHYTSQPRHQIVVKSGLTVAEAQKLV